jgi:hypothetical protein
MTLMPKRLLSAARQGSRCLASSVPVHIEGCASRRPDFITKEKIVQDIAVPVRPSLIWVFNRQACPAPIYDRMIYTFSIHMTILPCTHFSYPHLKLLSKVSILSSDLRLIFDRLSKIAPRAKIELTSGAGRSSAAFLASSLSFDMHDSVARQDLPFSIHDAVTVHILSCWLPVTRQASSTSSNMILAPYSLASLHIPRRKNAQQRNVLCEATRVGRGS